MTADPAVDQIDIEPLVPARMAFRDRLYALELEHPDWPPARIARTCLRRMGHEERARYLELLTVVDVKHIRRARVRAIEAEAARAAQAAQRAADEAERAARRRDELAALRVQRERDAEERAAQHETMPWTARRNSRVFKEWAQTVEGQEFLQREADRKDAEAARRAEIDRIGHEAYFHIKLERLISDFQETVETETRLKLTAELLESSFALGDGQVVSWGDATVEQHQQRIDLLVRNAEGNVRTASRHQIAVHMIVTSGVCSLRQVADCSERASAAG